LSQSQPAPPPEFGRPGGKKGDNGESRSRPARPPKLTFDDIFAQADPDKKYADKYEALKSALAAQDIHTVAILAKLSTAEVSQIQYLNAGLRGFLEEAISRHRPQPTFDDLSVRLDKKAEVAKIYAPNTGGTPDGSEDNAKKSEVAKIDAPNTGRTLDMSEESAKKAEVSKNDAPNTGGTLDMSEESAKKAEVAKIYAPNTGGTLDVSEENAKKAEVARVDAPNTGISYGGVTLDMSEANPPKRHIEVEPNRGKVAAAARAALACAESGSAGG